MDKASEGQINNELEPRRQSYHGCRESRPSFEFYKTGINEIERGSLITAFLKRSGSELVTMIAILALCVIAREFIRSKNDGFDSFALVGCLITTSMIFVIGLLAMLRATKSKHAKDTQENQNDTAQSGVGTKYTNENGTYPRRNGRNKPDSSN